MVRAFRPGFLIHFSFISFLFLLILSGCIISHERVAPDSAQMPTFIAPTIMPTVLLPTPTSTLPPVIKPSSSTSKCTNVLTYISDLSISDGTVVPPGATIDKRWTVENSGSCNWTNDYKIKLISGDTLGASEEQTLIPIKSNSQGEIRMVFVAPETPQKYIGVWQAYTPDGQPFGDAFYINIVVKK